MKLKKTVLTVTSIVVALGGLALVSHFRKEPPPRPRPLAETTAQPHGVAQPGNDHQQAAPSPAQLAARPQPHGAKPPRSAVDQPTPAASGTSLEPDFKQSINLALAPGTSYVQRQAIWHKMAEGGLLDNAMSELEKRAESEPSNPLIPASLGQLCLLKAGQLTNSITDQGIFGLKADKVFDQALTIDPNNWEARFWKAAAMSYWPPMLNKSRDVMQHFVTLVEQQEAQPQEPQFMQTYLWLGKEYVKNGYPEYALEIWQRGLKFFPDHADLKSQIADAVRQ